MSAFRRRTTFAAPVIFVAACSSSKEPPKDKPPDKRFPGMTWNTQMVDMKCRATELGPNPPPPRAPSPAQARAIECPPGSTSNAVIVVGELADKSCGIVPNGCFEEACVKIKTPCPLPFGKEIATQFAFVWTIEKRGDSCHAEEGEGHDDCPPGVDCNPPQPRIVPCPPGVTEDKPLRVAELPNATCVIAPDGCKDETCAKEKIACPTETPK